MVVNCQWTEKSCVAREFKFLAPMTPYITYKVRRRRVCGKPFGSLNMGIVVSLYVTCQTVHFIHRDDMDKGKGKAIALILFCPEHGPFMGWH